MRLRTYIRASNPGPGTMMRDLRTYATLTPLPSPPPSLQVRAQGS